MTVEEWLWLQSLPRTTLHDRVQYYRARDALLDPPPKRVRPYVWWRPRNGWFDTRSPRVV